MDIISVIVPTYKPRDYLFECLNSICKQTLDSTKYEILVIVNGVKEPYYSHVEDFFSDKYNIIWRLFYIDYSGVSNARNFGIEQAKGDYICFIDDDDIISPIYLQEFFSNRNVNTLLVSNLYTFKSDILDRGHDYITNAFANFQDDSKRFLLNNRSFFSTVWGKLLSKKIIAEIRFSQHYKIGEDALFMAIVALNVKRLERVSSEAIYYRRLRVGSATRTRRAWKVEFMRKVKLSKEYACLLCCCHKSIDSLFILTRILAVWLK